MVAEEARDGEASREAGGSVRVESGLKSSVASDFCSFCFFLFLTCAEESREHSWRPRRNLCHGRPPQLPPRQRPL